MENMIVEGQSDNEIEIVDGHFVQSGRRRRRSIAVGIEGVAAQQRDDKQRRSGEGRSNPPSFSTRRSRSPEEHSRKIRHHRRGSDPRAPGKKDKAPKAKGNESPFDIAGPSRPSRMGAKNSYSSPVKCSDDHNDKGRHAVTEPRRRTLGDTPHRYDRVPSSPTSALQHRAELVDENVPPSKSRSQVPSTTKNAETSSARGFAIAGPSHYESSRELIHVDDSDDGDENSLPSRPRLNIGKPFESTGIRRATRPIHLAQRNTDPSGRQGAARGPQTVSHRQGREQQPSNTLNDVSSEEEIEQFSSIEARPQLSKVKETSPAPPERHVTRVRKQMQDRNGITSIQKKPPRRPTQSKLVSNNPQIPSSKLRPHVLVRECFLESSAQPLPVSELALDVNQKALMFTNENISRQINLQSIAAVFHCNDDNFVLDLSLDNEELLQLSSFLDEPLSNSTTEATATRYTDIRALLVVNDSKLARLFIKEMSVAPGMQGKTEDVQCSGKDFLANGDPAERYTKATRDRSASEVKAGEAAIRRQAALPIERPKPASVGIKKSAQMDSRQSTLNLQGTRKSSRLTNLDRPAHRYNESSLLPEQDPAVVTAPPPIDKKEFLFRLHGLDITAGERYRLVSNDFLNDTFLEFGLRYVLDQLPLETRDEVHCFNSFFYAKLSEKSSRKSARYGGSWPGYDAVKRWTRKVDIFSKKFIIVPVNESYHWYLAVIFNPRGAVDMARASRPLVADALRDRHDSQRPSPPSEGVALDDNLEDVIRNESPPSAAGVQDGRRAAPSDNEYSPDTDPLNIIDQPDDEPAGKEERGVVAVRAGVNRLQIEAAAPQPIRSDTFDLFTEQSLGDMGTGAKTEEPTSQAPSPLPARKGKKPHREDYNLLGTDETWIFTLDSMGSRHPSVGANLRKWLSFEARDKLNEEVDFEPVRYFEGKCLEQHNFYDCGLYLIHFAKQLLLKSDEVLHFIGGAPRTAGVEGHAEWTQKKNEVWAADALSTLREDWVHIIDFQTQTYRSLHGSVATGQVVQETGALASQRSVQALSQGPPPREASTTPAALSGTIDGENAANHTHSSESTLSSVYMRVPAPLSPSRVGNESQAPAAGVWSKDASSTSHSLLTGKAEDNPGSRPRVSHCLSDSEEEEEIEVRQGADRLDDHARASYENDEDDELELEEIGREAQAAIDVAERQSRINQVAEAELNHVYGYDGSEDDDLCRRATIDPNMPPPHRDGSPPKPLRPTAILPRTNEKMVVDEAKGLEVNLPTATAQASCTVLSPNIIDPFAELGTSGPIHRESVGDGRTDPKRSSTAYAEHSPIARSRSVETEVTVASSSSQSKLPSSGEHGNLKPLVPGATRRFGETLRFNPFHMDYKRPEEAAPSLDAISNDDDSPDNNRVSSLIQRHQRTPPWEGPGSKRALRSELSNINSPTGPPTTRQASRSQASASGDGEVQAQYLPARGAGKRRASIGSANIPESDDKVLSDSEGSDYLLGRSQGTKHHSKPVTLAVKTNGQVAATQTKVHGLGAPSVVVVDGDNEDEGPAVGPSDGPEREASLEPPRPKRRAAKTYTHDRVGRNKRRKTTQDVAGQRKIDGYLPRNETAILSDRPRSSRFHDHTAGVERRGISAEDPYVVEDDE